MYFSKFWPPVRFFSKTYWKTPHCVVISNCRFVLFPLWKSTPFQSPFFSIIKQWIVRIKCMNRRKTSSSLGNMSGSGVQIGFDLQHYGFPPGCLVPALWFAPWSFPRFASCTIFSGMVYSLFLSEFCRPCFFYLLFNLRNLLDLIRYRDQSSTPSLSRNCTTIMHLDVPYPDLKNGIASTDHVHTQYDVRI